jgi:hypothetical protein
MQALSHRPFGQAGAMTARCYHAMAKDERRRLGRPRIAACVDYRAGIED